MAYENIVDPEDQIPEGAVWSKSTLFDIPLNIFMKPLPKKQNISKKRYGIKW